MLQDPGGRAPAPGPLRVVQAFVNTLDIENGVEELEHPEALRTCLVRIGVLPADSAPLGETELRLGIETREALRELALGNSGIPPSAESLRTLERVARAAQLELRFDERGDADLVPATPGVDGALGRILAVVHRAIADGSWVRLKACPRDVCHWLFWDRSRNGAGKWCAMSVCGNRTNTRAYRRRRTGARLT